MEDALKDGMNKLAIHKEDKCLEIEACIMSYFLDCLGSYLV